MRKVVAFLRSYALKTLERRYHARMIIIITIKPDNAVTMQVWLPAGEIRPENAVTMQVW